jgi:hypothetical protein
MKKNRFIDRFTVPSGSFNSSYIVDLYIVEHQKDVRQTGCTARYLCC